MDIGHFTSFHLEEEIQQRKFLSLLNTLTINLLNSVLTSKMDYGTESISDTFLHFILLPPTKDVW